MSTLGTFDTFTTAKLGIYAAQHGLKVTGNNISNINTAGYTRQRVDQVSFKTGTTDRYASFMDNHVGSGALVSGINQIRDPFLDIRYRSTSTDYSYYTAKLEGLQQIAAILDEVGKGGDTEETKGDGLLYAQLQELSKQLRAFNSNPTKDSDTLVRGAAEALCSLFQNYAAKLEKLYQDTEKDFNNNIIEVNDILGNIQSLNKSIREAEIHGDKALEMRDERNRQIDALSEFLDIKVEYSMEDAGAGITVEKLTIRLDNANPDPEVTSDSSLLVDGLYATRLSVPENKPVPNAYKDITSQELTDQNLSQDYLKLNGYMYTKKVSAADPANPPDGVNTAEQDADGNDIYLVGTNDPAEEGVIMEENKNYTVQLGELLDTHGEKWENAKTSLSKVGEAAVAAVYQFALGTKTDPADWNGVGTMVIGGTTYNIDGADPDKSIPMSVVTNPVKLASFVANALNNDPAFNQDYTITASGSNIVYTAKAAGAVGGTAPGVPAAAPALTVTGNVTLSPANEIRKGEDAQAVDTSDAKYEIDPFTGTETLIAYTQNDMGETYRIKIVTEHTREVVLDDNDLHGILQAQRELLTEEGEFASDADVAIDENAAIKRGIPYYRQSFDLLAQKFAEAYNELNTGFKLDQHGNYLDKDSRVLELTLAGKPVNKYEPLTDEQKQELIDGGCYTLDQKGNKVADLDRWLEAKGAVRMEMSGPLFSNSGDGDIATGINASNISVSYSWGHGSVQLVPKFEVLYGDENDPDGMTHSTQNINASHMVSLIDKALTYNPADLNGSDATGPVLFKGSFNDMFSNMMGVQAVDAGTTQVKLTNSYVTLVELDSSREGVSGVDLNDEAMNMMQYQKAYSAACRLMTVIDEALDRLIGSTGLAGR